MARNTADDAGIKYIWDKLIAKLATKVDKEAGKGLSTNDFTTEEKNKLSGIEAGAQVNPTIDSALSDSSTNPVQNKIVKGALDNKAGREEIPSVNDNTITIQLNGTTIESFTLNQTTDETINIQVTKSSVGLENVPNVSTNDQTPTFTQASTRANIASGEKLSVIFGKIMKWFADLKTVAFSGSYSDLSDKPTIPSAANNGTLTITQNGTSKGTFTANQSGNSTVELTDTTYKSKTAASGGTTLSLVTTGEKYTWNNKSNFSGSYTDLTNKPTIPAAVAVKGNAESAYRTGNVNITPANIGLGNVNNTADSSKNVNSANKVNYTKSTSEGTFTYPCEVEGTLSNNEDKIPNSAAVVNYLNSNIVAQTTKTFTSGSVTVVVYFYKYGNGMKHIKIENSSCPTNEYVSEDGFVPDEYKSVHSNSSMFFAGMNGYYTNTGNYNRARMLGITFSNGRIFVYGSNGAGMWLDAFYY